MQTSLSSWMRGAAVSAGVALAVAMAPGVAMAGTVTETVSVPTTLTNWSATLNFAGFNALAPGEQLTGVTFDATESLSGSISVTNNGSSSITGTAGLFNSATISLPTSLVVLNSQTTPSETIGAGLTVGPTPLSGFNSQSESFSGAGLSAFLGAYTAGATDNGSVTLSFGGGNITDTFVDNGALSILATYTYQSFPVPEPTSVALLGFALLGLGLVRFKRS